VLLQWLWDGVRVMRKKLLNNAKFSIIQSQKGIIYYIKRKKWR